MRLPKISALKAKNWKKMPENRFPYPEEILQWIWEKSYFDGRNLHTTNGKPVHILNPGTRNETNGPDFRFACIKIGDIEWHGSVELHVTSKAWNHHGHHTDENYNQVVLHVVAEGRPVLVRKENGLNPPTLNLLPHIHPQLKEFIASIEKSAHLPCSGIISFISSAAFEKQIEKAHLEYLEKKTSDFLSFYSPDRIPSEAWKHALILSLFDGFGITYNREPMVQVGKWVLEQEESEPDTLISGALNFSGFGEQKSALIWNTKGVYPLSHPSKRIPHIVQLAHSILHSPFEEILEKQAINIWNYWIKGAKLKGSNRAKILFGTVYLPSILVLSKIVESTSLTEFAVSSWKKYSAPIPPKLLSPFHSFVGIKKNQYVTKLGAVHQLRNYCWSHRCYDCEVLKKVISS